MYKEKRKGIGMIYGMFGVATLVVAIIGATFAYFTASQSSNNGDITGNAASVSFGLRVERAETTDQTNGGLIPMSNSMVNSAVATGGIPSVGGGSTNVACVDDNGNSVCQIYKITVFNTSSAALFLDGYVTLNGGLATANASTDIPGNPTVMRWAQVFKDSGTTGYSTSTTNAGTLLGASNTIAIAPIGTGSVNDGQNKSNIYTGEDGDGSIDIDDIYCAGGREETECATINGNNLAAIKGNYIRLSSEGQVSNDVPHIYDRTELQDALVFDMLVPVRGSKELYIVVWLHETGTKQNPTGEDGDPTETSFFGGIVTFQSGQGGEVTATFSSVAKVSSQG